MPQNLSIDVPSDGWTLVTDANVTTAMTFQNIGGGAIFVLGTNGTAEPVATAGLIYRRDQGESQKLLSDLFPGVTGVNRLWARGVEGNSKVFVSHA